MKTPHLIIAVALVIALISLVCASPASAASISFIEVSEGASILLLTSGLGSFTASVGSESASVTVGTATGTSVPLLSIGLTGQGSTQISDLISARAFISGSTLTGAFQISFDSDTEGPLTAPPGVVTTLIPETGLPQVVFSGSLPLIGLDLTITARANIFGWQARNARGSQGLNTGIAAGTSLLRSLASSYNPGGGQGSLSDNYSSSGNYGGGTTFSAMNQGS